MLTLDEGQWQALKGCDDRQFVAVICDQFLANRPDRVADPGRDSVLETMQAAYDYALQVGFTSRSHIVRLMYLAADAPRIHDDPQIDAYLRKPGATPEQRLDDLFAVMDKKLEERKDLWRP